MKQIIIRTDKDKNVTYLKEDLTWSANKEDTQEFLKGVAIIKLTKISESVNINELKIINKL